MDSIIDIINLIASDNSRLHKERVMHQHADNAEFKEACRLALDPFTQFYIRKIPEYSKVRNAKWRADRLSNAMNRLSLLSNRTLTGNAGIDHLRIILESVDDGDAEVIKRIIAKDLRCGVSDATVNKIWPGLIPEYPCMLASAYDQKLVDRITWPAIAQLKMDGMRFNAIVKNKRVEFRSRNGKEIEIPDANFAIPFRSMAETLGIDTVFDGELIVVDDAGKIQDRKTGNGILNKAVKGTMSAKEATMVRATIWDIIALPAFQVGLQSQPYRQRLKDLCDTVNVFKTTQSQLGHLVDMVESRTVNNEHEARRVFEKYLEAGQEGIILKTQDGVWENKRSKNLIKFKGELECDLRVVDWEEGTGKNVGRLGALVLESDCGGIRVNVGTGFSDADRDSISRESSIGRIVAIKYNARIKDKNSDVESLFLPVFVEFRNDKSVADDAKAVK